MGKQTKRQKKFQASGGVKGRLEKGTITKKGKLKKRKRASDADKGASKRQDASDAPAADRSDDFANLDGKKLGDLNVDEFFAEAAKALENSKFDESTDDDEEEDEEESHDDDDDDDDKKKTKKNEVNKTDNSAKPGTQKKNQSKQSEISGNSSSDSAGSDEDHDDDGGKAVKKQSKERDASFSSDDGNDGGGKAVKRQSKEKDSSSSSDTEDDNDDGGKAVKKQSKKRDASSSSDSDDDSDDEDVEAAEKRMKDQMAKLTKSDPEFHDFLQENEKSLLEFGHEQGDEEAMEEESDGEDRKQKQKGSPSSINLDQKGLESLEQRVFDYHSLKHLKRLISAYRSACHLADSKEDSGSRPGESGIKYIIESSGVFDKLMVTCLSRCHEIFRYHIFPEEKKEDEDETKEGDDEAFDENKPVFPNKMEKCERWKDMRMIMMSFFNSTLHIMAEAKEPELLTFVLKALSKYMPLLSAFPRMAELMLKSFIDKWSAPLETPDYQVVRINAFFRIRQLATTQPFPFIETCLKKTYLAYARCARQGKSAPTVEALSTLTFMGNSVVEMYSLDLHSSYQHAFVYIRQLALQLRTAILKATPETLQILFRWQYVHCLKLWVAVLCNVVSQDDSAQMRSLLYPLSEVIYGVARLAPSNVRHLPFRFHCVRLLQQLAAASETYIPTTSLLLDCLEWKEWYMKPKKTSKKSTTAGLDMIHILKLPKEDTLRTHDQLEAAVTELFSLLEREVDLYIYTAAFPEFSIWIRRRAKKFCRDTRQPRWRRFAEGIVAMCEKHATNAVLKRAKLMEAPKDVKQLECLRPISVLSMKERHKVAMEKDAKRMPPPPSKTDKDDSKMSDSEEEEEERAREENVRKSKKAKKSPKDKTKAEKIGKMDPKALEQEDEVHQGLDWSDEED